MEDIFIAEISELNKKLFMFENSDFSSSSKKQKYSKYNTNLKNELNHDYVRNKFLS